MSGTLLNHLIDGRRLSNIYNSRPGQQWVESVPVPVRAPAEIAFGAGKNYKAGLPLNQGGEPIVFTPYSANDEIFEQAGAKPMGPLLNRVVEVGRGVWNTPGNVARRGLDGLESATYNHLMRNAGDRAETLAQKAYMSPDFVKPDDVVQGRSVFSNLYDNEFANLQDRAKGQAALIPGGLRFAGRASKSPLAMTAYGVGGTLLAGNMLEEQNQREQLMAMGLSPEEAEILANELAMAAQNMEPIAENLVEEPPKKKKQKQSDQYTAYVPGEYY